MKRNKLNRKFRRDMIVSLMTLSMVVGGTPVGNAVEVIPEAPQLEPDKMTDEQLAKEIGKLEKMLYDKHDKVLGKRLNENLKVIIIRFYQAFGAKDETEENKKKEQNNERTKVIKDYVSTTRKICKILEIGDITELYQKREKFKNKFGQDLVDMRGVEKEILKYKNGNEIFYGKVSCGSVKVGEGNTDGPVVVECKGAPPPPPPPGFSLPGTGNGIDPYVLGGDTNIKQEDLNKLDVELQIIMKERPSAVLYDDDLFDTLAEMSLPTKKRLWELKVEEYNRKDQSWNKKKQEKTQEYLQKHALRTEVEGSYDKDGKKKFIGEYESRGSKYAFSTQSLKEFFDITGKALNDVEIRSRKCLEKNLQAYSKGGGFFGMRDGVFNGPRSFEIPNSSLSDGYKVNQYCIIPSHIYEMCEKENITKVQVEQKVKEKLKEVNFSGFSGKIIIDRYDDSCKDQDQLDDETAPFRGVFGGKLIVKYPVVAYFDDPKYFELDAIVIEFQKLEIPMLIGRWGAPDTLRDTLYVASNDLVPKFLVEANAKNINALKDELLEIKNGTEKLADKQKKIKAELESPKNEYRIQNVVNNIKKRFKIRTDKIEPYWKYAEKWDPRKKNKVVEKFTNSFIENCLPDKLKRGFLVNHYQDPTKYDYGMVNDILSKLKKACIENLFEDKKFNEDGGNVSRGGCTFREYFEIGKNEKIDLNKIRFHFGPTAEDIGFYYGEVTPDDIPFYTHLISEDVKQANKEVLAEEEKLYVATTLDPMLNAEIEAFKKNKVAYDVNKNRGPFTYNNAVDQRMKWASDTSERYLVSLTGKMNKLLNGRKEDQLRGQDVLDYKDLKDQKRQFAFHAYAAKKFKSNDIKSNKVIKLLNELYADPMKNGKIKIDSDVKVPVTLEYQELEKFKNSFCDFLLSYGQLTEKEKKAKDLQEKQKKDYRATLTSIRDELARKVECMQENKTDTPNNLTLFDINGSSVADSKLMDLLEKVKDEQITQYSTKKINARKKISKWLNLINDVKNAGVISICNVGDKDDYNAHFDLYQGLLKMIDEELQGDLTALKDENEERKDTPKWGEKPKKQLLEETLKKYKIDKNKLDPKIIKDMNELLGIDEQFESEKNKYEDYLSVMKKMPGELLSFKEWMDLKQGKKIDHKDRENNKLAVEYAQYLMDARKKGEKKPMTKNEFIKKQQEEDLDKRKQFDAGLQKYRTQQKEQLEDGWLAYKQDRKYYLTKDEWIKAKEIEKFILPKFPGTIEERTAYYTTLSDLKNKDKSYLDKENTEKRLEELHNLQMVRKLQNATRRAKLAKYKKERDEFLDDPNKSKVIKDWIKKVSVEEKEKEYKIKNKDKKEKKDKPRFIDDSALERSSKLIDDLKENIDKEKNKPKNEIEKELADLYLKKAIKAYENTFEKKEEEKKEEEKKEKEKKEKGKTEKEKELENEIKRLNEKIKELETAEKPLEEEEKDKEKDKEKDEEKDEDKDKDKTTGSDSDSDSKYWDSYTDDILSNQIALEDKITTLENAVTEKDQTITEQQTVIDTQSQKIEAQDKKIKELEKSKKASENTAKALGVTTTAAGLGSSLLVTDVGRSALQKIAPQLTRDLVAKLAATGIQQAGDEAAKSALKTTLTEGLENAAQALDR